MDFFIDKLAQRIVTRQNRYDSRIENLTQEAKKKEAEYRNIEAEYRNIEAECKNKEAELSTKEIEFKSREADYKNKEAEYRNKESEYRHKEAEYTKQISDLKEEIVELKEEMANYEKLLQEMKLVNLKNMESANRLNDMAEDMAKAYEQFKSASENSMISDEEYEAEIGAEKDLLKEFFDKQDDTIHKENIKVYRNVQAAMNDSLGEQTKSILEAQTNAMSKSRTGFIKVMTILIFIAVLADIALKVLPMFGIQF